MKVKTKSRGEMALVIVCLQVLKWISGANLDKDYKLKNNVKETRILITWFLRPPITGYQARNPISMRPETNNQSSKEAKQD